MNDARKFSYSEIISYMENAIVKSHEIITSPSDVTDRYFDIEIKSKKYPSCYRYNVLIMLAKRLIKEEENKPNILKNRRDLELKLAQKIIS